MGVDSVARIFSPGPHHSSIDRRYTEGHGKEDSRIRTTGATLQNHWRPPASGFVGVVEQGMT